MEVRAWAIVASIGVAISGYLFTHFHDRRVRAKAAQLDRVNLQLRNLYGPLYAILKAGDSVWDAFQAKHWPAHGRQGYFGHDDETTDAEKLTWRIWMTEVFEPLNARMESAILNNLDLVEGGEVPQVFLEAIAHVAAYRAVYRRWQDGDFSEHISVFNFPSEILRVVEPQFKSLLAEQQRLISKRFNSSA
jgi:hypothetical protein